MPWRSTFQQNAVLFIKKFCYLRYDYIYGTYVENLEFFIFSYNDKDKETDRKTFQLLDESKDECKETDSAPVMMMVKLII